MASNIFTPDQLLIIKRLQNQHYGYKFLANVIDPEMYNARIKVDFKNKKAYVLIQKPHLVDKKYEQHVIQQANNWVNYLIDISFVLIDTLIKFEYAEIKELDNQKDDEMTFGPGAINMPFDTFEIHDSKKVESLLKYASIQITIKERIQEII